MKKRFTIKWEIDEFAETPLEALRKALLALPCEENKDTLATVFEVSEIDINTNAVKNTVQIDILEQNLSIRPTKLEELADLFKEIRHELPINLTERNKEFELYNGGIAKQLLEDVCIYEIECDGEEFDAEYRNLTDSDIDEIIRIIEDVKVENKKP
jgi:hypothetical protein